MLIDARGMASLSEANQNFSRVARLVDERGSVVILRNNVPLYVVLDYARLEADAPDDAEVLRAGSRLIARRRAAFEELSQRDASCPWPGAAWAATRSSAGSAHTAQHRPDEAPHGAGDPSFTHLKRPTNSP